MDVLVRIKLVHSGGRYDGEKLYVIKSFNLSGTLIYTKGGIAREGKGEYFYILVAAKIATVTD